MRKILLALAVLAASPALAQNTAGTQSDVAAGATLDLTVSCAITTPTALCPDGSVYEVPIGNGQGVVGADITGLTGSGAAIMVDRSIGGSWSGRNLLVTGSAGSFASTVTQDSSFTLNSVASRAIRFRVSTAGVGTARIFASATANSSIVQFATSLPAGNLTLGGVNIVNSPTVTVGNLPSVQAVSGSVSVSNFPAVQPVSATALPLPAGAATETTSAAMSAKLPASLGSKAGASSLSVVPNTDTPFPIFDRGAANYVTGQVAVGTTDTLIVAARPGRRVVVLYPTSNTTYYIASTTPIATATSAPLGNGAIVTLPTSAAVYARGASGLTIGWVELF